MGVIIHLNSKDYFNRFIPETQADEYQYVLISENITTKEKFKNVKAIPRLIPPVDVIRHYIDGDKKAYKKAYLAYLSHESTDSLITVIVKAAVDENMKMVLMCSKSEDEYGYLELIAEYIESVYGLQTYTAKKYLKDQEKATKIKNKDDIRKVLTKKLQKMEKSSKVDLVPTVNREKFVKQLKKLKRKELREFAKRRNIKIDKDLEKKDILKIIIKKLVDAS